MSGNGFAGSPISASKITGFYDATVAVIESVGGISGGVGMTSVATSGSNILGNGQVGNPLYLNDNLKLTNLESTRISGSSITASSLVIVDDNTNDDLYLSVLQYFNYPFALMTNRLEFGVSWFSYIKASGTLTENYLFPTNFYIDYLNTNNIDFSAGLSNTQNLYNIGNINNLINTDIYNVVSGNHGIINTSSILRITDYFTDSDQTKRNNILNSYGILMYPLEVGLTRYPLYLENKLDSTREFVIDNSGNLGIGTKNTTQKLNVNGNVLVTGSLSLTNGSQITNNPKTLISSGSSQVVDTYSQSYRTAKYIICTETNTGDYQVQSDELLVSNNGSVANAYVYATAKAGLDDLASFSVSLSDGNVYLTINNLSTETITVTLSKHYLS